MNELAGSSELQGLAATSRPGGICGHGSLQVWCAVAVRHEDYVTMGEWINGGASLWSIRALLLMRLATKTASRDEGGRKLARLRANGGLPAGMRGPA